MRGRGLLGKWGPNHAADPIVTRFHPETGVLQLVAILRADVQRWALPGGMVEAGQGISATIRRDFEAEVGDHDDPEEKATMSRLLDALFAGIDDDEGLGGHLTLTLTLPKTLTLALTLTQTLTLTLTLALTLSLTLTVTRPRRPPPPGQPTPRAPPGLPRLRRRPAQHRQRVDRDERLPLPLHRG